MTSHLLYGTTSFKLQNSFVMVKKKKKLRLFIGNSSKWDMGERNVFQQNSINTEKQTENLKTWKGIGAYSVCDLFRNIS